MPRENQAYFVSIGYPKLEEQLEAAKHELAVLQRRIEQLNEELAQYQLKAIKKAVINFDFEKNQMADVSELFSKERRILNDIINNQPSLSQLAQDTLDNILMLITHLSDKKEI